MDIYLISSQNPSDFKYEDFDYNDLNFQKYMVLLNNKIAMQL